MATIIEHLETREQYILLGTGFGAFQSEERSTFLGVRERKKGQYLMAAVSDQKGLVGWLPTDEIRVLSVEGMAPAKVLPAV